MAPMEDAGTTRTAREILTLSDEELLRECAVDTFRGAGPGGQKRNKTANAVRVRHRPTGLSGQATESRSQQQNRRRALRRLRWSIALDHRQPPSEPLVEALRRQLAPDRAAIGARHPEFLQLVGTLLDVFVDCGCSVSGTAQRIGRTTGVVSRLLHADDALARRVDQLRATRGLRPLRRQR